MSSSSHRVAFVVLVLLAVNAAEARALEVKLAKNRQREGEWTNVLVSARGPYAIECDIDGRKFFENHEGEGFQSIAFGAITKPGIYTIRATQGKEGQGQGVAFVALLERGRYELVPIALAFSKDPDKALLTKFAKAVTKERLQAASAKGFANWSVKNPMGASTTLVVGFFSSAQSVCVWSGTENSFDLGIEISGELIDILAKDNQLTADEAALLRKMLQVAKATATAKKVVAAESLLAKSLEAIPAVAEAVVKSDAGKMLAKFSADETEKIMLIINTK